MGLHSVLYVRPIVGGREQDWHAGLTFKTLGNVEVSSADSAELYSAGWRFVYIVSDVYGDCSIELEKSQAAKDFEERYYID